MTAVETEEGRHWAEARIKQLTGGKRSPRGSYAATFLIFGRRSSSSSPAITKKPSFRSVDEAIRRRFHLIPFVVTIPERERDPELSEKLKDEWPGILQWMIEGALEWQTERLRPPAAILAATGGYLASEDSLAVWLDECCDRGSTWESSAKLFGSWSKWAASAGEYVGSAKEFTQRLEEKGFVRRRDGSSGDRGFKGLMVKADPEAGPPRRPSDAPDTSDRT